MNEYMCLKPQLREVLSIIGIYPVKTVPHPREPGWEAWVYDRSDIKTDTAINTYYALKQLEERRRGEK